VDDEGHFMIANLPPNRGHLVLRLTFELGGATPMPLSPAKTKYIHYMNYLPSVIRVALGIVFMGMPFFIDGGKNFEMTVVFALLGLGFFLWGAFSFWRHSRRDPATPVYTIDDLPLDQRVRTLRRMILIIPIAFTPLAAFVGYDLAQVEYGWATSVRVWAPVALLYNNFGFWPAVLFVPAAGLLLIMYMAWKLRTIRETNPTIT